MHTYAEGGRTTATPIVPQAAAATRSAPASPSMVADQLDALLGEHLMPLRVRSGDADEPHLLAVDASGEPVVVEIVALLDEDAAIRALRHAGQASRMSTADLAAAYGGGPERFAAHLAAFRLTVPSTALLSTFVRGGARLLLVCSHIAPGMEDALEFLLQPGWQVDVLRAEVVGQSDGSRVVELSPVSRSTPPDRTVDRPEWARDVPAPPDEFDPTPLFRAHVEENRRPSYSTRPSTDRPSAERSAPRATARQALAEPTPIDWDEAPRATLQRPSALTAAWGEPRPGWPWPPDDPSELLEQTNPSWASSPARPAPVVVPPSFAVPVSSLDAPRASASYAAPAPAPRNETALLSLRPDPALAAVADVLDGPVVIVWCPLWARECYEALLHADGTLETADGARYGDVEAMSRAISGYAGPLDAWQVWHVDSPTGPSLGALAAEIFPGQF